MKKSLTIAIMAALLLVVSAGIVTAYDIRTRKNPPLTSKKAYTDWMAKNTKDDPAKVSERWDRMQRDLQWYKGHNDRLQYSFLMTPREHFARKYNYNAAYANAALPIEDGQTISGPHIQIRMTYTIMPTPDMKVLEIGTGSGNQSAMLAQLSNHVYSIEIKENAHKVTDSIYAKLKKDFPMYNNVHTVHADGYYGWKEEYGWDEEGPIQFDRIIVTCGIDHIPPMLLKQLAPNGIMCIPVGTHNNTAVLKVTKKVDAKGRTRIDRFDIYGGKLRNATNFVPFTDKSGKSHNK